MKQKLFSWVTACVSTPLVWAGTTALVGETLIWPSASVAQPANISQSAEIYFQYGEERLAQEDYQGAIEAFSKAIRVNPSFASAYQNRAIAHIRLGHRQEAIADYSKAADLFYKQGDTLAFQSAINAILELRR